MGSRDPICMLALTMGMCFLFSRDSRAPLLAHIYIYMFTGILTCYTRERHALEISVLMA